MTDKYTNLSYFVKAERGRDDRWLDPVGPYPEFFQLTYQDLRIGPDGEIIAQMDAGGDWYFQPGYGDGGAEPWSDLVLYAEIAAAFPKE